MKRELKSLYLTQLILVYKWQSVAELLLPSFEFDTGSVHEFCFRQSGTGKKFYLRMLRFAPVSFIPAVPHIHLHLNTALIKTKRGSLEHINTSTFRFFSVCRVKLKRNRNLNLMSPNVNVRPTWNNVPSPPYISISRWLITTRSNFTSNRDELYGNITNCAQLKTDGPGQSRHSSVETDRNNGT